MAKEMSTEDAGAELIAARSDLLDVLEGLEPSDWDKPTLCAGWRVRDVVAHLAEAPELKARKLVPRVLRARGDVDKVLDEAARTSGSRAVEEILGHFRANLESSRVPPGSNLDAMLVDTVIHSLDICHPNGWELELPADRARRVLSTVVEAGDLIGAKERADGLHFDTTDIDWRCGCGDHVRGPAPVVLLALAGRPVCDQLTGDGVSTLAERA